MELGVFVLSMEHIKDGYPSALDAAPYGIDRANRKGEN